MNTIHFIGGNRGNIGKSFFSTLLCHFYNSNNRSFDLFDTDTDKQDVAAIYKGITDVSFDACNEIMVNYSSKAIEVDTIYEKALKQDVIVNMPSDSHSKLIFWLEQNGLNQTEFLLQENIQIYIWYLSNGDSSSLNLLKTLVEKQTALNVVLVKNKGIDHQWSENKKLDPELKEALTKISQVELDIMPRGEREATFTKSKSYSDYLKSSKTSKLSVNRLKTYLANQSNKIYQIFSLSNSTPDKNAAQV